jgi:hypothetical protein
MRGTHKSVRKYRPRDGISWKRYRGANLVPMGTEAHLKLLKTQGLSCARTVLTKTTTTTSLLKTEAAKINPKKWIFFFMSDVIS